MADTQPALREQAVIPVIVLLVTTAAARVAGLAGVDALDSWQTALRVGLAVMLVLTASAHWGKRRPDLVAMVPDRLPRPDLLVTATGVLELVGAAGLLYPPTTPYAAAGLVVLFLALFPANISAARRRLTIDGRPVTPLPARAAMQVLFIAAAIAVAA